MLPERSSTSVNRVHAMYFQVGEPRNSELNTSDLMLRIANDKRNAVGANHRSRREHVYAGHRLMNLCSNVCSCLVHCMQINK
jgi:hypothetical protein